MLNYRAVVSFGCIAHCTTSRKAKMAKMFCCTLCMQRGAGNRVPPRGLCVAIFPVPGAPIRLHRKRCFRVGVLISQTFFFVCRYALRYKQCATNVNKPHIQNRANTYLYLAHSLTRLNMFRQRLAFLSHAMHVQRLMCNECMCNQRKDSKKKKQISNTMYVYKMQYWKPTLWLFYMA